MQKSRLVVRALIVLTLTTVAVFAITPVDATPTPGYTSRVSVSTSGVQSSRWAANTSSAMSPNGRYIVYSSWASNLVPGDTNNTSDVFCYDRGTGITSLVSRATNGALGNHESRWPAVSNDGRYVAFESYASNFVEGDQEGTRDIFVTDRATGVTSAVSVDASGAVGNAPSIGFVSMSADGRYVTFLSEASNLVPGDTNGFYDVFVRDLVENETWRANVDSSGNQANSGCGDAAISADGRYVVFTTDASNLVAGDTNGLSDAFVHDNETGVTTRVSLDPSGAQANGSSNGVSISADGRYVAFASAASNLVEGDVNGVDDIFVHDVTTGANECVSVGPGGESSNGPSIYSMISGDGNHVAFSAEASNLVAGDGNNSRDVFIRDRTTGVTSRRSVSTSGQESNSASQGRVSVSNDGGVVAFDSDGTNLVAGDTNLAADVFVYDRLPQAVPTVGTPEAPQTMYSSETYSVSGLLAPVHAAGSYPVRIYKWKRSSTGGWTSQGYVTARVSDYGDKSKYRASVRLSSPGSWRLRAYAPADNVHAAAWSGAYEYVTVRNIDLSTPRAASTMSRFKSYVVYGYLKPRHTSGSYPVRIYKYCKVSGHWKSYGYVKAKAANYSTYTKYSAKLKLAAKGSWRLRAYAPSDSRHLADWSAGYDYVTVR